MKLLNMVLPWCKKNFLFLLFFLLIFPALIMPADIFPDDSTVKKGEIFANHKPFRYEGNYDFLNIYDMGNNLVFSTACLEKNTLIKGFGFSDTYHSFFVFKEKFNPDSVSFDLSMEFEGFNIPIIEGSATAFYTPVLVENTRSYVIYISEDFSIVIYDPEKKLLLQKIKSKSPVMKLFKSKIGNREIVGFQKFSDGKYKKNFFYVNHLGTGKIKFFDFKKKVEELDDKEPGEEGPFIPSPDTAAIPLDYRKIIGFGDSITTGVINRETFPELGYVPRLQILVNQQLYDEGEVINEGIPGSNTDEGVIRIEDVILLHKGKYLLFHLGTNDVINYDLPTSTVVANIKFIIDMVLKYNMQPILTTLIPRWGGTREDLKRLRGKIISDSITELSVSLNLPLIDLWDIFLYYPDSDGGYLSLMSDKTHPSEKGYQLMAEEWMKALLDLPPMMPTGISISRSRDIIILRWRDNPELDLSHYVIKFGYSPSTINRILTTTMDSYVFIRNPLFPPFYWTVYFQIQAVDNGGNASSFTPYNSQ